MQRIESDAAAAFSNLRRKSIRDSRRKDQPEEPLQESKSLNSLNGNMLDSVINYFENQQPLDSTFYSPVDTGYYPPRESIKVATPVIPKFTFYSEITGVRRSNSLSGLDLSLDEKSPRSVLESGTFWLDVTNPNSLEMEELEKVFGLHPLTCEDILMPDTREKCEVFQDYFFVVIKTFDSDQYQPTFLTPITINIVIFEDFVLTISSRSNHHALNVRKRIDLLSIYGVDLSSEWVNYAIVDDIIDGFLPIMKIIEHEVDTIEDLVLILNDDSDHSNMIRRIGMVRKRVMLLYRLTCTKADVIKTIINRYNQQTTETKFYLEDIHDHITTMNMNLMNYDNSLSRSHSNYLAQISINITKASNRTSDIGVKMTILASILVPLNIITGLWGMNVKVPGQGEESLAWFFSIIAVMIILVILTFSFFVRSLTLHNRKPI